MEEIVAKDKYRLKPKWKQIQKEGSFAVIVFFVFLIKYSFFVGHLVKVTHIDLELDYSMRHLFMSSFSVLSTVIYLVYIRRKLHGQNSLKVSFWIWFSLFVGMYVYTYFNAEFEEGKEVVFYPVFFLKYLELDFIPVLFIATVVAVTDVPNFIKEYIKEFDIKEYTKKLEKVIRKVFFDEVKELKSNYLISDSPLNGKQSILYEKIAEQLKGILIDTFPKQKDSSQAFVVAINAPWGRGKTSLVQRLIFNSKGVKDRKIIQFSAWNTTTSTIEVELLNNLKKQLSGEADDFIMLINQYLELIDDTKYTNPIVNFFRDRKSDILQELNDAIGELNQKLIIVIDDLDRISKDEVSEALKLIRTTSYLKNVVVVCLMDYQKLDSLKIGGHFLEKIVNLKIDLPVIKDTLVKLEIERILEDESNYLSDEDTRLIKNIFIDFEFNRHNEDLYNQKKFLLNDYFTDVRKLKIFFNSFFFDLKVIGVQNVNLVDFFWFKYIELFHSEFLINFKADNLDSWSTKINDNDITTNIIRFDNQGYKKNILKDATAKSLDKLGSILFNLFKFVGDEETSRIGISYYLPVYLNKNIFSEEYSIIEINKAILEKRLLNFIQENSTNRDLVFRIMNHYCDTFISDDRLVLLQFIDFINSIENITNYQFTGLIGLVISKLDLILYSEWLSEEDIFNTLDDQLGKIILLLMKDENIRSTRFRSNIIMATELIVFQIEQELQYLKGEHLKRITVDLYKNYINDYSSENIAPLLIITSEFKKYNFLQVHVFEIIEEVKGLFYDYLIENVVMLVETQSSDYSNFNHRENLVGLCKIFNVIEGNAEDFDNEIDLSTEVNGYERQGVEKGRGFLIEMLNRGKNDNNTDAITELINRLNTRIYSG